MSVTPQEGTIVPSLIKDLIDVPERVQAADFVLKLAEGVDRADDTLRQYVVTPQLVLLCQFRSSISLSFSIRSR
jgi:hypothetical protein